MSDGPIARSPAPEAASGTSLPAITVFVVWCTMLAALGVGLGVASLEVPTQDAALARGLLVGGLVAMSVATVLAIYTALATLRSIRILKEHIHRQSIRADMPEALIDPMPDAFDVADLRDLGLAADDVLQKLARRQAELRHAAEEAARATEALRVCVEDSSEAKMLLDGDEILLVNPAATRMLGMPADRLLGQSINETLAHTSAWTADGEELTQDTWLRLLRNGSTTVRFDDGSRRERWVELTIASEPGGRILATAHDVTEARQLQAIREELLQLVTHDLRAPLSVINGYLDILRRPLDPEARDRALDAAKLNAQKMGALLDDLLAASGAEQVLAPRAMLPVSVLALAQEVAASLPEDVTHHPLEVIGDGRPMVLGEERRLRQALANLVTNALKHTPDGTPVRILASAEGDTCVLAVEDDGPGIPAGSRSAVFDRFRRLETEPDAPGLGLGLYIVRLVVENHGGAVRIEESPGGGARFVVELPLAS